MKLTDIWKYYVAKETIPSTMKKGKGKTNIKNHWNRTKRLLSNKFCNCVKKLEKKMGVRGIGICTASVFNQKGLRRVGSFTCKPNHVPFRRETMAKNRTVKNKKK